MSVFPKRTKPGGSVTIHLAISPSNETGKLLFPKFTLDIKNPTGKIERIVDTHLILGPSKASFKDEEDRNNPNSGLTTNTPLLVLADYLDGSGKRRELANIIKRIPHSLHYYFHYAIPDDAELGKYTFTSETFLDGQQFLSGTREDDFFLVEKLSIGNIEKTGNGNQNVLIRNHSPEITPLLMVNRMKEGDEQIKLIEVPGLKEIQQSYDENDEVSFLYNEGREALFIEKSGNRVIRNQTIISFEKIDEAENKTYVMFPDSEEAYILSDEYKNLWNNADGSSSDTEMIKKYGEKTFEEMRLAGLIVVMNQ